MPNVYKPYLIQVRPQYSDGGVNTPENILWFTGSVLTGYELAQLQDFQTAFDPLWLAIWEYTGSADANYKSCYVTDWTSDTGLQTPPVADYSEAGSQSGYAGAQVAELISIRVPQRYRGGHPRIYLPAIGAGALTSMSTINPTYTADQATAYETMITTLNTLGSGSGGPYSQVVYRFRDNEAKATLLTPSSIFVNDELATQRRRLRRVTRK